MQNNLRVKTLCTFVIRPTEKMLRDLVFQNGHPCITCFKLLTPIMGKGMPGNPVLTLSLK